MSVLVFCLHVYLYSQKPEDGAGFSATGVTDGFKLQCSVSEMEPGSPEKNKCSKILVPSLQLYEACFMEDVTTDECSTFQGTTLHPCTYGKH